MSDINKQLKDFSVALSKYREGVHEKETKFVTVACAEIERQAKTLMRDTAVDMEKTYGKRGHHPSLPGNAPAPDTGTGARRQTLWVQSCGVGRLCPSTRMSFVLRHA